MTTFTYYEGMLCDMFAIVRRRRKCTLCMILDFPNIIPYKLADRLKVSILWKVSAGINHSPSYSFSLTCMQVSLCVACSNSRHTLPVLVLAAMWSLAICEGGTSSSLPLERNKIGILRINWMFLYERHRWWHRYTRCRIGGNTCGISNG